MINVQEIRRNVINVVKNYSDAQVKVRKATSNEPWGPSSTLMGEIADLTYNVVAFSEIMQIIWKRLNDHGKNWRHVYKALVLLEYLIKTGSEKVAQQCRDNLFAIQTLRDFQHFEDNKDQGLSIREKSKLLVNLLKDEEKLKIERARALKAKERFSQSVSYMGTSADGNDALKASTSYHETLSSPSENSSRSLNVELENARPQTVGEEELQLQLALAMSKEEAEQEERLRKNDDIRLKLALEESEKNSQKKLGSRSAVDELLSLSSPLPSTSNMTKNNQTETAESWDSTLLPPPLKNKLSSNDPWTSPTLSNFDQPSDSSNFPSSWNSPSQNNDPWAENDASNTDFKNDPWDSSFPDSKNKDIGFYEQTKSSNSMRLTPESFLGPNSSLVNLDALVSSNKNQAASPSNNPFASVVTPVNNPFQTNKPSQPTINELRAQSSQQNLGQPMTNYSSSAALNSLFNTPPTNSQVNNFNPVQNNVWGFTSQNSTSSSSKSQQPNNPFAM